MIDQPAWGQVQVSNAPRSCGLSSSPAAVRCVCQRHDLEKMNKCLKALEAKAAQDGHVFTEDQIAVLQKAKADKEAHGALKSEHPSYRGAQDHFYVGMMKGVSRVYQQTFVDTYSKIAFTELYDRKTPTCSAQLPNDRGIPFFDEYQARLLRTPWCNYPI